MKSEEFKFVLQIIISNNLPAIFHSFNKQFLMPNLRKGNLTMPVYGVYQPDTLFE